MSWSFRKSINLGSGVRMNLSRRGVGYSFGSRGSRVSTGPRGTYVSIGAGGIRYRTRIDSSSPQVISPRSQSYTPPITQNSGIYRSETIETASVSQLVDEASAATLGELNSRAAQIPFTWLAIIGTFFGSLVMAAIHPILGCLAVIAGIYGVFKVFQADRVRRTYPLFYELDSAAAQRFDWLNQTLSELASNQRLWRIHTVDHTYDWKRNAGANQLMTRTAASAMKRLPPCIATNVSPFTLMVGTQVLYFMPDRLYVWGSMVKSVGLRRIETYD